MPKLFILVTLLQWKVWYFFPEIFAEIFFLKIGILSAKVYTKKVPNVEEFNFIHALLRIQSTKQVILVQGI